jgi:hypothetical protein
MGTLSAFAEYPQLQHRSIEHVAGFFEGILSEYPRQYLPWAEAVLANPLSRSIYA